MSKQQLFIVVFDDDDHIFPMAFNADCEGAIECAGANDAIALFETRSDARTAINISAAYARLCLAQGKTANTDFIGASLKCIKIRALAKKS
jgi:hypothetical protein